MTITPDTLYAMRARDRAFGDGESEDASDIAADRHALLAHCAALAAEVERLRAALAVAERGASLCADEMARRRADREADPCPGSRRW